jgi:1,4-alpha-glucan branching enzyme
MLKAGIEKRELGMTLLPGKGARMLFWSPFATTVVVKIRGKGSVPLEKRDYGYWEGNLPGVESGDRYMIVIDDERKIPDPASLCQPEGVHRESQVSIRLHSGPTTGSGRESHLPILLFTSCIPALFPRKGISTV